MPNALIAPIAATVRSAPSVIRQVAIAAGLVGASLATLPAALAGTVSATDTNVGTSTNKKTSNAVAIHGSATVTFSAPESKQWLTTKTAHGITGLGIWSKNDNEREIEVGERLLATFSQGLVVSGIRLGLLFDGPEFSDVQETARITATFAGGGSAVYTLSALANGNKSWNGLGSVSLVNGPANTAANGGVWDLLNPFGNSLVTSLSFTAVTGVPGAGCHWCKNQSDFVVMSVTAVPEPATVALMLAGLGVVGAAARRRRVAEAG
jgi:hypothetical protein